MNKASIEKHIASHPDIHHGKPCVRGTRVPVYAVLEALALGIDADQVCREFAPLTREDLQACVLFAALLANEQELAA